MRFSEGPGLPFLPGPCYFVLQVLFCFSLLACELQPESHYARRASCQSVYTHTVVYSLGFVLFPSCTEIGRMLHFCVYICTYAIAIHVGTTEMVGNTAVETELGMVVHSRKLKGEKGSRKEELEKKT